tara:strand:- start:75 stop:335 length:261 start_codon:yes stop_codon:yes gene_type:complete
MPMRELDKAKSWAINGKHVIVYPTCIANEYHKYKNSIGKTIKLNTVRITIEIGNAKHNGKETYKQNSQALTDKINEIYMHYYNKRS